MKKDPVENFKERVFEYDDYRDYLKDYLELRREIKSTFTQRYFAQRYGFSSPSFCNFVINGKRNLSDRSLSKLVAALELNATKADYFESLVHFNQTADMLEKDIFFNEMQKLRKRVKSKPLTVKQSDYFSKWYNPVLRELVVHLDWDGSFEKLASNVNPEITAKEAKESIELMLSIGVLLLKDGVYSWKNENIDDSKVPVYAKKKARRDLFLAGVESLESMSPQERHASFATVTTDEKTYNEINALYEEFLDKVTDKVNDSKGDKVFQVNYSMFPVSKKFIRSEK